MTTPAVPRQPAAEPAKFSVTTLQHVRWSLLATYAVYGVVATSWLGRLPSVREELGVTSAHLGVLLFVLAAGTMVGVMSMGTVIARLGTKVTMWAGIIGACAGFILAGVAVLIGSSALFVPALVIVGLASPAIDIPANLEAARVEKLSGKVLLPALHGAFCIGSLIGVGLAALTSLLQVSVAWHIIAVAILITVARCVLVTSAMQLDEGPTVAGFSPARRARAAAARRNSESAAQYGTTAAWRERRTLLIGLIMLVVNMSGSTAANWLNIGVVDGFRVSESIGAVAYMTYVGAMFTVRVLGARITERMGRVAAVRASIIITVLALSMFIFAPNLVLEFIACALWGAGAALIWPIGTQAATDDPDKATARVSVVNSIATISTVAMPPVLGVLAGAVGVRNGMLVIVVALIASLALVGALRPQGAATRQKTQSAARAPITA